HESRPTWAHRANPGRRAARRSAWPASALPAAAQEASRTQSYYGTIRSQKLPKHRPEQQSPCWLHAVLMGLQVVPGGTQVSGVPEQVPLQQSVSAPQVAPSALQGVVQTTEHMPRQHSPFRRQAAPCESTSLIVRELQKRTRKIS